MSALAARTGLENATATNASGEATLLALFDFVAQRLAAGTTGAGVASAAELLLARNSLGLGAGADVASAATLNLTAANGKILIVTGAVAVTAVTLNNGQIAVLFPAAALPLTYHATNNPVQGGRSYVCEPGDMVIYSKDNSGVLHNQIVRACGNTASEVGQLVMTTGNAALPGTIKLNGALLNRVDYPNLWAFANASGNIEVSDATWTTNRTTNGTNAKFSPGDGTTTFRAPDVRGDHPRFWSDGSTVDSGRAIGSYQAPQIGPHDHYTRAGSAAVSDNYGGSGVDYGTNSSNLPVSTDGTTATTGPGIGTETRVRNSPFLALVKF